MCPRNPCALDEYNYNKRNPPTISPWMIKSILGIIGHQPTSLLLQSRPPPDLTTQTPSSGV